MRVALRFDRSKAGFVEDKRKLVALDLRLKLGMHQVPYGTIAFLEIVEPSFVDLKQARPTLEQLRQAMREHVRDEFEICVWPPSSDRFLTIPDYAELMEPDYVVADLKRRAAEPPYETSHWDAEERYPMAGQSFG
jgi:hypothetical protein